MSGECPKRRKRQFNKGKGRFRGGKRRSGCDRHIRATSDDGDDDSGEEKDDVQESKPDNTKNVRALMKGMSKDERNGFLTVGLMTVDEDPNEMISVPDTIDILNVTVHLISERRISIPI